MSHGARPDLSFPLRISLIFQEDTYVKDIGGLERMEIKSWSLVACFAILLGGLSGCSSSGNFDTYYSEIGPQPYFSADVRKAVVVETLDLESTLRRFLSDGYVLIGEAYFEGDWVSRVKAIEQAEKVGAVLVISASDYMGKKENRYSFNVPVSSTSYHSGSLYTGSGYASYSGSTTTISSQKVSGVYAVGQYKQRALFLAREEDVKHEGV